MEFTLDLFLPSVLWMLPGSVQCQSSLPACLTLLQHPKGTIANTTDILSSTTTCYCAAQTRRKVYSPLTCTMSLVFLAAYVCASLGTVLAALASSPHTPPQARMVTGLSGVLLCWESTINSLVLLRLSCTWLSAAHVEAIHGITASLLLSLTNTSINKSNIWFVDRVQERCQLWVEAVSICWKRKYIEISRQGDRESDSKSNKDP